MKKHFTKLTAAFLTVVMVFLMMPIWIFPISAEETTTITGYDNFGYLGSGYNLLGDQQLSNSSVTLKSAVFDDDFVNYVNNGISANYFVSELIEEGRYGAELKVVVKNTAETKINLYAYKYTSSINGEDPTEIVVLCEFADSQTPDTLGLCENSTIEKGHTSELTMDYYPNNHIIRDQIKKQNKKRKGKRFCQNGAIHYP